MMKQFSLFKQICCNGLLGIVLFLALTQPGQAATASDSPNASDSTSQEVLDNVKKALQEKKDELKDLGESSNRQQAYLAKITRVSEETLAVQSTDGSKIIPLSDDITLYSFKDKAALDVAKLAVDNWIAVYGDTTNSIFTPKKVVVYDQDFSPKEHKVLLGSIAEINKTRMAITPRASDEQVTFLIDKNTKYQDYQGKDAKLTDFYEDLQCLIVADANSSGDYVISTIRALVEFDE